MSRKLLAFIPQKDRVLRKVKYLKIDGYMTKCYAVWKLVDIQSYKTAHSVDLRKTKTSSDK
jgi:hypothetical protein